MSIIYRIKHLIPKRLYTLFEKPYHYVFAYGGALLYRYPSRKITVVGVTGTKGKSSTIEIINAVLEEAGISTAIASTIRFKVGKASQPNRYKMTMPGRFFIQHFLHQAVKAHCRYALIEMTSEGVKQFRHKFIHLDTLIFTNIAPEHIESHGSFENYLAAKLEYVKLLEQSPKKKRMIIANSDDAHGSKFLKARVEQKIPFSLSQAKPYNTREDGIALMIDDMYLTSPLHGLFNVYNILAALSFARSQKIPMETIKNALLKLDTIPGRVEFIEEGQPFSVVVDYAHTPESLEALYKAFEKQEKICVLGSTGGGRDTWKRPRLGALADQYCKKIILTDEDSYDENPDKIINEVSKGIKTRKPLIIVDRREAIRNAINSANKGDIVLITGKGTDPFIMGPRGSKKPWSDAQIAREELLRRFEERG